MFTLAIETSGMHGSVAVLRGAELVREFIMGEDQRSAQTLTLALQELLAKSNTKAKDISLIAVAHGPGSFTGLRVGIMAAKTLAYVWKCEVLGVDTLQVIARQAARSSRVWAVLDAQRQQLFAAKYDGNADCKPMVNSQLMSREDFRTQLQPGDVVTGAGLKPLREKLPADVIITAEELWQPSAATVGELGWLLAQHADQPRTWQQLEPHYLRGSAAEENPKFQRPA